MVLCLAIVLSLPFTGHSQNPLEIRQARASNGTLTLEWTGDSEFYEVQAATKLAEPDWRAVLRTDAASCGSVSISGPATFFRVLTLPDWGARIVDTSRRMTILKAISQQLRSLSQTNVAANSQALAQFLSSFPQLEGVQRSEDHSVSAYFTDGRPLIIVRNRRGATPSELARKFPLTASVPQGADDFACFRGEIDPQTHAGRSPSSPEHSATNGNSPIATGRLV